MPTMKDECKFVAFATLYTIGLVIAVRFTMTNLYTVGVCAKIVNSTGDGSICNSVDYTFNTIVYKNEIVCNGKSAPEGYTDRWCKRIHGSYYYNHDYVWDDYFAGLIIGNLIMMIIIFILVIMKTGVMAVYKKIKESQCGSQCNKCLDKIRRCFYSYDHLDDHPGDHPVDVQELA